MRETAPRTIRVLIADDHPIVRQGLGDALSEVPDLEVVGQASDGQMALELTGRLQPDVVLMDTKMPRLNGILATRLITARYPKVRVVALAMCHESHDADALSEAGAADYLPKGMPMDELAAAIRAACPK